MNKLKNLRLKLSPSMVVTLIVGVLAFGSIAVAYGNFGAGPKVVVEGDYIEAPSAEVVGGVEEDDEIFGSVTSVYLPGPEFAVGKDLQFSVTTEMADATSTWAYTVPFRASTSSASDVVVEYIVGTDNVGLTVPTTTIELVRTSFTSSTPSAFQFGCGSSASPFTTSTNSIAILTSDSVGAALGNFVVENGVATGAGARIGGGSVTKIMLGPSHPYLVCRAFSAVDGEWSGADGVSPGDIAIRFSRVQ